MPDVTEILYDPEVGGGQAFQVIRNAAVRKLGGYEKTTTTYDAVGNIQPQTMTNQASTLEDLLSETIVIYSTFAFQTGSNTGTSIVEADIVVYNDLHWRVTGVDNWSAWGFTRANATRVMDNIPVPEVVPEPEETTEG